MKANKSNYDFGQFKIKLRKTLRAWLELQLQLQF